MSLSDKENHRLTIRLGQLFNDESRSRQVVTQAGLNTGYMNFGDAQNNRWSSIINEAQKQQELSKLILFILDNIYQGDEILLDTYALLKSDYSNKLKLLAKTIQQGQCILFLGPGSLLQREDSGQVVPFKRAFAEKLALELDNERVYYDKNERYNLNYIAQRYIDKPYFISGEQGRKALEFYNSNFDRINQNLFEILAHFHFPIIINTNPDENLAAAIIKRNEVSCVVRHYSIANNSVARRHQQENQQRAERLLYNVLGSFADPYSILTAESHLLNFTTRVLRGDPPLDPTVLGAFDDHKYYLFLGFDFDQWYMKIMFDTVLRLVKKNDRSFSIHSGNGRPISDLSSLELFEEEFKFFFIREDVETFLKKLLKVYKEI